MDDVFSLHRDLFDYEYITDLRDLSPSPDDAPLAREEAEGPLHLLLDGDFAGNP